MPTSSAEMRLDVSRAEFDALGLAWQMCDGPGPAGSYAQGRGGEALPVDIVHVRLIQKDYSSKSMCVSYADLVAIAQLFNTTHIDIDAEHEGPLSDVTPGNGFGASIYIYAVSPRRTD